MSSEEQADEKDKEKPSKQDKPEKVKGRRLVPKKKPNGRLVGLVSGLPRGMAVYEPGELYAAFGSEERIAYLVAAGVYEIHTVKVDPSELGPALYETDAEYQASRQAAAELKKS